MTRSFFSMVGIAGGIALVTALKISGLGFVNQTHGRGWYGRHATAGPLQMDQSEC